MGKMYTNSTIIYNKMNWFELENNKKVETRNYNGIGVKRQGKKKKKSIWAALETKTLSVHDSWNLRKKLQCQRFKPYDKK